LPEIAAAEAGIPWDEAAAWLTEAKPAQEFDDDALRQLAARALSKAVETLERLAENEHGRETMSASMGTSMSTGYDDLAAAKALMDGALKLQRMIRGGKKVAAEAERGKDLFDRPGKTSPWKFRKAE
jgi:hypothetical protein